MRSMMKSMLLMIQDGCVVGTHLSRGQLWPPSVLDSPVTSRPPTVATLLPGAYQPLIIFIINVTDRLLSICQPRR